MREEQGRRGAALTMWVLMTAVSEAVERMCTIMCSLSDSLKHQFWVLVMRCVVLDPTSFSKPLVGALLNRRTMSCWSISLPLQRIVLGGVASGSQLLGRRLQRKGRRGESGRARDTGRRGDRETNAVCVCVCVFLWFCVCGSVCVVLCVCLCVCAWMRWGRERGGGGGAHSSKWWRIPEEPTTAQFSKTLWENMSSSSTALTSPPVTLPRMRFPPSFSCSLPGWSMDAGAGGSAQLGPRGESGKSGNSDPQTVAAAYLEGRP